jgi:hypothetical protein
MAGPSSAREAQAPLTEPVGTISEVETNTQDGVDDLTERVAETLKPLLKDPSEVQKVVTQVVRITEESYSGPTPHPEHLERIERIAPGSARAIINMAASEQRFRHRASLRTVLYPYAGCCAGSRWRSCCLPMPFSSAWQATRWPRAHCPECRCLA